VSFADPDRLKVANGNGIGATNEFLVCYKRRAFNSILCHSGVISRNACARAALRQAAPCWAI